MIKADQYFLETIANIEANGIWDKDKLSGTLPRTRYQDGEIAHSKYINSVRYIYDISKGEFPINTLRKTALKGAFHDIEAIYIKQTNRISDMHPSIHSWWLDFVVNKDEPKENWHIGQTYGHTVKRYGLMDELLTTLELNPYSRRKIIDLWQKQQMIEDPKALVPCAKETIWEVRDIEEEGSLVRYIDVKLDQRSQDYLMTASINPAQYVMKQLMVVGHLNFHTKIQHKAGLFIHDVSNVHIYDRHFIALEEIKQRKPLSIQPIIKLKENKHFYDYTVSDFEFLNIENILPLETKLELAV